MCIHFKMLLFCCFCGLEERAFLSSLAVLEFISYARLAFNSKDPPASTSWALGYYGYYARNYIEIILYVCVCVWCFTYIALYTHTQTHIYLFCVYYIHLSGTPTTNTTFIFLSESSLLVSPLAILSSLFLQSLCVLHFSHLYAICKDWGHSNDLT